MGVRALVREFETLAVSWRDRVAVATLNRPERRNAINRKMNEELDALLDECARRDARALVLTGGESVFSVGADLVDASAGMDAVSAESIRTSTRRIHELYERMESWDRIIVAAIGGYALGGGLELALACDIRIAATNASLGLPEIRLGILPGGGGTQRILRHVPRSKALELLLTGQRIDAAEAHRIGIVDRLVPEGSLLAEAETLASTIADQAPLAVAAIKEVVRRGLEGTFREGLAAESEAAGRLMSTEDAREGILAFIEKRRPTFRGR